MDPQAAAAGNAGERLISPTPATATSFVSGIDDDTGKSVQKFADKLCPVKISTTTAGSGNAIEIVVGELADRDLASTATVTAISRDSDSAQKNASAQAPDVANRTSCGGLSAVDPPVSTPVVVAAPSIDLATFVFEIAWESFDESLPELVPRQLATAVNATQIESTR